MIVCPSYLIYPATHRGVAYGPGSSRRSDAAAAPTPRRGPHRLNNRSRGDHRPRGQQGPEKRLAQGGEWEPAQCQTSVRYAALGYPTPLTYAGRRSDGRDEYLGLSANQELLMRAIRLLCSALNGAPLSLPPENARSRGCLLVSYMPLPSPAIKDHSDRCGSAVLAQRNISA